MIGKVFVIMLSLDKWKKILIDKCVGVVSVVDKKFICVVVLELKYFFLRIWFEFVCLNFLK